jgi:ribosome-binding factor A
MSRRTSKIASSIWAELSRLFLSEISDPTVQGMIIHEVDLSADLRQAHIYYSGLPNQYSLSEKQKGLKRITPFIKRKLADNLDLRFVPELIFKSDEHVEQVNQVMSLLDSLSSEEKMAPEEKQ